MGRRHRARSSGPINLIGRESKKRHFWRSPGVQTYNGAFHNLLDGNQRCQRLNELREITKRTIDARLEKMEKLIHRVL